MMDVLGLRGKKFQKSTFCGSEFLQVVKAMFKKCDRDEFTMFVGTSKKIWFSHNTVVHGGGRGGVCHPNNLCERGNRINIGVQKGEFDRARPTKRE